MTRRVLSLLIAISFVFLVTCGRGNLAPDLVQASAKGDTIEVKRLLDSGANPDAAARDDWTPLTVAAREGHESVVRLLIDHGADVNRKEGGGHNALFWARKYRRLEVEKLLVGRGAIEE